MLTILWSPLGFAVVEILPKGPRFDVTYLCSEILSEIDQNRPRRTVEDQRQNTILHFDSATLHTARETAVYLECHRTRQVPHPLLWSDLVISDFYLFGKVKAALMGEGSAMRRNFLTASGMYSQGSHLTSLKRFLRLNTGTQKRGGHVEESESNEQRAKPGFVSHALMLKSSGPSCI
jgi:hypothetical protein